MTPLPPTPTLETERLTLRPMRLEDAPAVQRIFPQWEVVQWLHAHVPWPYPDDGGMINTLECLERMGRRERFYWAITLKSDRDALIGRIDLWPDNGGKDMRGFWLDPLHHGQGLMTEAAERVTEYAFEELGWTHLWLNNAEANTASHRVKEKQGARIIERVPRAYVGGMGVAVIWLLLREDWLARRGRA